jgi:ubiquinone/menaquinone biosynthesis C-methylase UbiE
MKEENSVTKSWFKDWSNEYDKTLGKVDRHNKLLDLVVDLSGVKDGEKVLDIGCGTGLLSLKFLEKADCIIYGIDNSSEMLEIFKEKIKKLNLADKISLGLENAENIDFRDEEFDIIASTVTLHHVKEKYPVIKKIYKFLKPGGRLLIGDIDVDTTGDLEDPERLLRILDFLKDEFVLALKGGGVKAFSRMYDNGKKHILNDGEYCVSFRQWKGFCEKAGFKDITIKTLTGFQWFKVLVGVR